MGPAWLDTTMIGAGLIISQGNLSGSQTVLRRIHHLTRNGTERNRSEIAPHAAFAAEKLTIRHNRNGRKAYFALYFQAYTASPQEHALRYRCQK